MSVSLTIKDLNFRYDKRKADGLSHINLTLSKKKIYALLGPSGSGKSTLLKLISENNLPEINLQQNETRYLKSSFKDENISLFNFLFDQLCYYDDPIKQENQVRATLLSLDLSSQREQLLSHLSHGQRQRALIASCLIHRPSILLLDEPFGHLDEALRHNLMKELFDLLSDQDVAIIWATHHVSEALMYSDEMMILNHGKLIQFDETQTFYQNPKDSFVAKFLGYKNVFALSAKDNKISFWNNSIEVNDSKDYLVICQHNAIKYNSNGSLKAKVQECIFTGPCFWIKVSKQGQVNLWVQSDKAFVADQRISFDIDTEKIIMKDLL